MSHIPDLKTEDVRDLYKRSSSVHGSRSRHLNERPKLITYESS